MARTTRATVADILAPFAGPVVALAEALRASIRRAVPEAVERPYPGWKAIGYAHPAAGYFAAIFPGGDRCTVVLEYGSLLADPSGLFGTVAKQPRCARYVGYDGIGQVAERQDALTDLLLSAVALQTEARAIARGGRGDRSRGEGR
ncbi:MAG: hypothetical protein FJ318_08660 [SAR202 cluster bacterium]|nr:hypothetical protein [SAR202 cluster bacterium]